MIVLGLSGLPNAQPFHLRGRPDIADIDRRVCQGMDSAASLVVDGEILAAAAEERFTGDKGTGALPEQAIAYCLEHAGITSDDVDVIAHGFDYDRYRRFFHHTPQYFAEVLTGQTVVDALTAVGWRNVPARFRPVEHHIAHAASACYLSGYDNALSVVADGMGEVASITVHQFRDGALEELHSQDLRSSLGLVYSIVTRFLGYVFNSDEYKVMGLSAYGDPTRFNDFFETFLRTENGRIAVDWPIGALEHGDGGYSDAMAFFEHELRVPRRDPAAGIGDVHADIAAAFQRRFTQVLTGFIEHWLGQTGNDSLCLSGGSFLNCLANGSISRLPQVKRMFVTPAAGDDGTAMGAALHVAGKLTGNFSVYTGPAYDESAVVAAAQTSTTIPLEWDRIGITDEYFELAADDLAADRIIAWFSGRMEFGPRALGNRSILALPGGVDIKNRLNHVVKMRESYRPFAPAILESDYRTVFETPLSDPARYMLTTATVRPEYRASISGAVHVDGSARVQVVHREDNETFWRLLHKVKERTGLGCVINTSFNVKNQPIIRTPELAVGAFETMAIDRLYIEGFRVGRSGVQPA